MKRISVVIVAAAIALTIAVGAAGAKDKAAVKGMAAVEHAAKAKKYLLVFFYSDQSEQTSSMRQVFRGVLAKAGKKAESVEVDVTDPAQAGIIDQFGVRGAPMPLVLAIAPNGAVTGGFPSPFDEKQLLDAFVTPCTQTALKALQENKTVLLCVQNRNTKLNDAAMKGVQDFKADPTRAASTEILSLDPSDPAESKLLETLAIDPKTDQALTVCLVPPGRAAAKLAGATTKEMIANSLRGGGGGCCGAGGAGGAKGCGPAPAASKPCAPSPVTTGKDASKPGGTGR